jgi:O-antigen/teichoic acid export membrane protein
MQAMGLTAATFVARLIGLVGSFVLAGLLGPAAMGPWSTLRALLGYGNLNHLGALEAYRREHPRLIAQDDPPEAQRVEDAALGAAWLGSLATSLAGAIAAITIALLSPQSVVARHLATILALCATVVPITLGTFWNERLGVRRRFGPMARLRALRGLAYAVCLPLGAFAHGLVGTAIALWIAETQMTLTTRRLSLASDGRCSPKLDLRRIAALVGVGFPITFAWWTVIVQDGLDRLAALSVLGGENAGHYAIAVLIASCVFLLPEAISRVLAPDLCAAGAAKGGTRDVEDRIDRVADALALWLPFATGIGAVFVEPFLSSFLPRYVEAADPARILLLGASFAALVPGGIDLLVATDRSKRLMLVGPLAIGARLGLCAVGAVAAGGPAGVAMGAVASNLVFVALLGVAAHRVRTTRRFVLRMVPTCVVGAAYLTVENVFVGAVANWSTALPCALLVPLLALALLGVIPRHGRAIASVLTRLRRKRRVTGATA